MNEVLVWGTQRVNILLKIVDEAGAFIHCFMPGKYEGPP